MSAADNRTFVKPWRWSEPWFTLSALSLGALLGLVVRHRWRSA